MANKTAHKIKTRARILEEAALAIRTHGVHGVSVAELMKRAGLTHGGFYAHFESRDDLVAHAIDRMFEDNAAMAAHHLENGAGLGAMIDYYLSDSAYRNIATGCPIPSLASEVSRMPLAVRDHFESGINRFRDSIAASLSLHDDMERSALANSILAELVGAMTLARAMPEEATALTYLAASKARLKARLGL